MAEGPKTASLTPFQLVITALSLLLYPTILFILAGDWRWPEAWVFSVIWFVSCYGCTIYLYFTDPALLKERYSPNRQGWERWDKIFIAVFMLLFHLWFVIMPLDARRFSWSPEFPLWVEVVGAIVLVISMALMIETFRENTFAAPIVKVQEERHQKVISTGLYGIIRHPMYLGALFLFVGPPLLLGSLYGLAVGFVTIVFIAMRSIREEKLLARELAGYAEYMKKVRWRLIPYVF
jgi:protein-S-isoprenylcysteine O-methyltransferase Ste14